MFLFGAVGGAAVVVVPLGAFAFACACPILLAAAAAAAAGAAFLHIAFLLQGLGTVGAVAGIVSAEPVVLFSPRIPLISLRPPVCCRPPGLALAGSPLLFPMLLG